MLPEDSFDENAPPNVPMKEKRSGQSKNRRTLSDESRSRSKERTNSRINEDRPQRGRSRSKRGHSRSPLASRAEETDAQNNYYELIIKIINFEHATVDVHHFCYPSVFALRSCKNY